MRVPETIAIELQAAGDSRTMFRLRTDATVVTQAHLLVGDILERIALPNARIVVGRTSPMVKGFGRRP